MEALAYNSKTLVNFFYTAHVYWDFKGFSTQWQKEINYNPTKQRKYCPSEQMCNSG